MRSYCSIDNLLFVINEFMHNYAIPSGVYNLPDDEHLSTNEIISLMAKSNNKKTIIFNVCPFIIKIIAKIGDVIPMPVNSERILKLAENFEVSNLKIKKAIQKELPLSSKYGIEKTVISF